MGASSAPNRSSSPKSLFFFFNFYPAFTAQASLAYGRHTSPAWYPQRLWLVQVICFQDFFSLRTDSWKSGHSILADKFFFFHFIASCLFQDLSALNISFPFAIHDTSWKFHRTKADPMHWLSSTILILDSCELRKTTAGLNFVLLFNLKILFALA